MAALILLLLMWMPRAFGETPCGDRGDLEIEAYRRALPAPTLTCLEAAATGTDPAVRSEASFVLIVHAYARGNHAEYERLMRRHLTELHTTDAEVAYLYARHLWSKGDATDEVLHWARVAMDSRRRWLHNRANYDRMVRSLYDMMVQVSMERAIEVEQQFTANPTNDNRDRAERYKRQARYFLITAAPCLHYGDCGPYFEIEVEGWAPCDDLVQMETLARKGQITAEHQACLKSKYRKPQAPKKRILTVLLTQANTDSEGKAWDALLAWHWNLTGVEDPLLAYHYAEWLISSNASQAEEALKWAQVALASEDGLTGRSGRAALTRLHRLRVETAQRLVADAEQRLVESPDAYHRQLVQDARSALSLATTERDQYCADHKCD